MSDILAAVTSALQLLFNGDPAIFYIIGLSLAVSLSGATAAALVGLPLGAALAVLAFGAADF